MAQGEYSSLNKMRCVIAGSRSLDAYKDNYKVWLVADAVMKSGWRGKITSVISGGERGIDLAGEAWAKAENPPIPIKQFIPDWNGLGKAAGPIRNSQMANNADALLLIWDGRSRGSANMLKEAKKRGLKIYEYIVQ